MSNPDKERYDRLVAEHRDPARLTAEILAYWQQQAAEARALNEIYVAEILAKSNRLADAERDLRDAEHRITLLDEHQRIANQTGYQTPYILAATTVETIKEENEKARDYAGPRLTDYPTVIGKIGYDSKRQQWTFEPDRGAIVYNGDTVIGQVINLSGKQVTAGKHRHDQKRNRQRS